MAHFRLPDVDFPHVSRETLAALRDKVPRCAKTIRMLLSVWIQITQECSMAAWRHEQPGPKLFAATHGNDTLAQAMARFVIYPFFRAVFPHIRLFIILIKGGLSR